MDYIGGNYFGTDIRITGQLEGDGPIHFVSAITLETPEYIQIPNCLQREVVLLFDADLKRFLNPEILFDGNAQVQNAYTGNDDLLAYIYEACVELGNKFYEAMQNRRAPQTDVVLSIRTEIERPVATTMPFQPLEQRLQQ